MSVGTDSTDEEVDASCFLNHLLVVGALCHQVFSVSIQDVHIILIDIDMVEKVTGHKRVIALRMVFCKSYILVHIKGNHILKRDTSFLICFHQTSVHSLG